MRFRFLVAVLVAGLVLLVFTDGCSKKTDTFKNEVMVLNSVTGLLRSLIREMEKSTNATGVNNAIIDFLEVYEPYRKEINKLERQYPDLKVTGGAANAPAEMKPAIKNFQEALTQLRPVLEGKISRYELYQSVLYNIRKLKEALYFY